MINKYKFMFFSLHPNTSFFSIFISLFPPIFLTLHQCAFLKELTHFLREMAGEVWITQLILTFLSTKDNRIGNRALEMVCIVCQPKNEIFW